MGLFVEDGDIVVSKSPFSAYAGESKKFDGRVNNISLDHVMLKVKREDVHGIDFNIIEAVAELEFSTSRMITQVLKLKGINADQGKIQNRLNYLNKINIISRYKIMNDESEVNTRIYCLEQIGKYLLLSREIPCSWVVTDSARPLYMMKQILARNQVLLTYRGRLGNIEGFKFKPYFKIKATNRAFVPDMQITFNNKGTSEAILFEVVRSYDGCMEKGVENLKAYKEFLDYFEPTPQVLMPPRLVIVGEDDKHLLEIYKQVIFNKIELPNIEFLYTSDLRVIGEDLSRSMISLSIVRETPESKPKPRLKELNYELLK